MNKEKLNGVINDYINTQIKTIIEDMSSQDFMERVYGMIEEEKIEVDWDSWETNDEIREVLKKQISPLKLFVLNNVVPGDVLLKCNRDLYEDSIS